MRDHVDNTGTVPEEFMGADSIEDVYAQVYTLNQAIEQGYNNAEAETESNYQQSILGPIDGSRLVDRFKTIVGQIRKNLETIAGENVESYTITMTGSAPPSVTLEVTYTPLSGDPE